MKPQLFTHQIRGFSEDGTETLLHECDGYTEAKDWVDGYARSDMGGYEFIAIYVSGGSLQATLDDWGHWTSY